MFGRNRAAAAAQAPGEALRLEDVRKVYGAEGNRVVALDGVSLSLPAGSFTAVMGPSGSGKSTLLQCAAGLDRPTAGRVFVDGAELSGGGEAALTRFRLRSHPCRCRCHDPRRYRCRPARLDPRAPRPRPRRGNRRRRPRRPRRSLHDPRRRRDRLRP